ncbi:DeoR family transcriptional regulator [Phycicoccus sp. BSK3Z-2]|uniref:DeoR family transcriptional regulator n=1 Tax=Phycicoccus avicenniae TaxID=2828860 RepID=A0A941D6P0_9MICO|nr:DeoR family transcriptional regulator [Phycicoccus avicenniae]
MLRAQGAVRTMEVATRLAVSPMTARRALAALAQRGHEYQRVHGGMVLRRDRSSASPS